MSHDFTDLILFKS